MSIFWAAIFMSLAPAASAGSMLMVYPVRLIFTERDRAIQAKVVNQSEESVTYSISVAVRRTDESGRSYEPEVENPEETLIKKMIRYSPRRAIIGPKQVQTVKFMLRKPKELSPGEYRAYLKLEPHPSASSAADSKSSQSMGFQLKYIINSVFPIVILHEVPMGEMQATALRLKPAQDKGEKSLELVLGRSGQASSFANVFLDYLPSGKKSKSVQIGKFIGVAIYAPEVNKTFSVPLDTDISLQELKRGKIRVTVQPSTGSTTRRKIKKNEALIRDFSL